MEKEEERTIVRRNDTRDTDCLEFQNQNTRTGPKRENRGTSRGKTIDLEWKREKDPTGEPGSKVDYEDRLLRTWSDADCYFLGQGLKL